MSEEPQELEVWKNDQGGNNHAVYARPGTLLMRVIKPGGSRWDSNLVPTRSTPEEWKTAFEGLGPKWNQDADSEKNDGTHYEAVRRASTPTETAVWKVDHTKIDDTQYKIRDKLEVILRETEHSKNPA